MKLCTSNLRHKIISKINRVNGQHIYYKGTIVYSNKTTFNIYRLDGTVDPVIKSSAGSRCVTRTFSSTSVCVGS